MFEELNRIDLNDIRRCDNKIPSQLNAKEGFTSKTYTNPEALLQSFLSGGITLIWNHVSGNHGDIISCSAGEFGSYNETRNFIYKETFAKQKPKNKLI